MGDGRIVGERRRRPHIPGGAEQFVVAYMAKLQVRQVPGREPAYRVPVLGAHTLGVAVVESTSWHGGGEADTHPVCPDFIGQGLGGFDHDPCCP